MSESREDILIGRVTDGEATAADWAEIEAIASADAGLWTRLAGAQRAHAALAAAIDDELTVAELVGLPDAAAMARAGDEGARSMQHPSVRWRAYSGWAAAAVLALAWAGAGTWGTNRGVRGVTGGAGDIAATLAPDALLQKYVDKGRADGRVLMELPLVMVESGPAPDGKGTQVVYLRRLLEQTTVSGVYEVGRDETGQFLPVPSQTPIAPAQRAARGL